MRPDMVAIRPMVADDAPAFARCMQRVYGDTYKPFVYEPDAVRKLLADGRLRSVVAVTPDGEIVAHQGVMREYPESRIAEVTMGIVDPAHRGGGLFKRLKEVAFAQAKREGLLGLYGEAVTIHDHSQKANIAMGARETGVMLGYIPAKRTFTNFDGNGDGAGARRQAAVLFYIRLNPEPSRTVYAPLAHWGMVERIYRHAGLDRRIAMARIGALAGLPGHADIRLKVLPDFGAAMIRVATSGLDLVEVVRTRLREAVLRRAEVVFLDLPLADPATQMMAGRLEALGFSFAGVFPESDAGDLLRLQYRGDLPGSTPPEPDRIRMATDFGRTLLAYTLDEDPLRTGLPDAAA
ncbi:GNAT family N-acetyltransferase [Azospirillum rugosum]|uniref:Ribosomal protein S18 acetylase RimI-like enzyme n=1 Tax=Azospirillum rugosum TaxID=416170 RepID=A0ABS4SCY7_9PROT|nr:hypothetical protein [Azospirillum rugosum]MBP2290439.1 ribosomal protein S18 acetylase RimI-like enzyme [Azospirillum rugosum]MDQ0527915.1 ribosomal protein S18 acetylase RimI-like enzyme [Azospirillum rugosum]